MGKLGRVAAGGSLASQGSPAPGCGHFGVPDGDAAQTSWGPQAAPTPAIALSDSQLRLQYAMALVRMVNGIADSAQKGRLAQSVASLAAAAGLPRILVDLRHGSTHNELPSAASLRLAADQALAWLQTNYWQRQGDHLAGCLDRVAELVQEFVSLHAAAAAKVAAASQGEQLAQGEEEEEDEETARRAAAASAAAAEAAEVAAALARGKGGSAVGGKSPAPLAKSSRAQPPGFGLKASEAGLAAEVTADLASPGVADAAGEGAGVYRAAEGQRRRKALLAELKLGVPRSAAGLLVKPLLIAGVSATTLAAAGSDPAALERALTTAMPHFLRDWPQLPGMLLQGAVELLTACVPGTAAAAAAAQPQLAGTEADTAAARGTAAAWASWVTRLLPLARDSSNGEVTEQQQKQQAGTKAPQGLVPEWVPSADLLRDLVALCLPALLACSHQAWLDWATAGSCTSIDSRKDSMAASGAPAAAGGQDVAGVCSAGEVLEPLQSTLRLLLDGWRSAGASSAELARCTALVSMAQVPPGQQRNRPGALRRPGAGLPTHQPNQRQITPQPQNQGGSAAVGGVEVGLSWGDGAALALERQLEEARQRTVELFQKRTAEPAARQRASNWAPCALGNLPSVSDPNGRLSLLDSPPRSCSAQPAAEEAALNPEAVAVGKPAHQPAAAATASEASGAALAPAVAGQEPQHAQQQGTHARLLVAEDAELETLKYFVITCFVLLLPGLAAAYRPLRAHWKAVRAAYEFQQQYPLFAALLLQQRGAISKLCGGPLAAALGPGSISVLHVCALVNDAASVEPLVAAGASLNASLTLSWVDPGLRRWLATGKGRLPRHKVYWLIEGSTPLQLAVLLGHRRTVQALVLAGADVASLAGGTLLSYCKLDPPAIQPLVHALAASEVALTPGQTLTLLHAAIDCSKPIAFSELLDHAVSQHVAFSAADIRSLVTAAICSGAPQPLQNLIDLLGVDPSGRDGENTCFAAVALQEGRLATFEQLLKAGAAVDGQFMYSILERRDLGALLVLLKHGRRNFVGSPAITHTADGFPYYNCPVLCLLHHNVEVSFCNDAGGSKACAASC
ncbi:hypothetical protein N2152v2_009367 [Parachlorella kessleri]